MMRIAMMNLVLHGIRQANVKRANTLSEMGGLTEDDLQPPLQGDPLQSAVRRADPQGVHPQGPADQIQEERAALPGRDDGALAPGGRCAVVVPEGLLFGSTWAHMELREKLLRGV